jgi:hypothetical protein
MQDKTFNKHLVYIADEAGMASVFPELKHELTETSSTVITILYQSVNNHFAFTKELNILERYFPGRLYISYESGTTSGNDVSCQRTIEAIINTNIIPQTSFILSGQTEFIEQTKTVLQFLGVNTITIHEQFFTDL